MLLVFSTARKTISKILKIGAPSLMSTFLLKNVKNAFQSKITTTSSAKA